MTSDVFLANFDLPTYPTLSYNVQFLGLFWTHLPTLKSDVILPDMVHASAYSARQFQIYHSLGKRASSRTSLLNTVVGRYWKQIWLKVLKYFAKSYKQNATLKKDWLKCGFRVILATHGRSRWENMFLWSGLVEMYQSVFQFRGTSINDVPRF